MTCTPTVRILSAARLCFQDLFFASCTEESAGQSAHLRRLATARRSATGTFWIFRLFSHRIDHQGIFVTGCTGYSVHCHRFSRACAPGYTARTRPGKSTTPATHGHSLPKCLCRSSVSCVHTRQACGRTIRFSSLLGLTCGIHFPGPLRCLLLLPEAGADREAKITPR